jgi:hypothetical protein
MVSAPSRFRHPIDAPDPVAVQYYRRFLRGGDVEVWREQADLLAASLWRGDPLADAWSARASTLYRAEAADLVDRALARGIDQVPDAPHELVALFRQLEATPLWVDPECLDLGCRTFRRSGIVASFVLSGFSLMGGYRSSAIAKVLMLTGRLRSGATRRLFDTGRFVIDVTEPGAMRVFAPGFQACVRVRLLHARIRRELSKRPEWRADDWGLPINQADMVGTNLLFSLGFLVGAREIGLVFSTEEAHAVIHLWRYVGHLLGIDEKLLPASEREAERVMYLVGSSQPPADEDSVELARALYGEPLERAVTEGQKRLARFEMSVRGGVSRVLLGDAVADELELPKNAARFAVRGFVPFVSLLESLRRVTPFGNELAYRVGDHWLKSVMSRFDGPQRPHDKVD